MLTPAPSYEALVDAFRWDIPEHLNMAQECCGKWLANDGDRVALTDVTGVERQDWTYAALNAASDRLALFLENGGISKGDRVGVFRSQGAWTLISHLAIWKLGAISLPLFTAFRRDAVLSRVTDAEPKLILTDAKRLALTKDSLPYMPSVQAIHVSEDLNLPVGDFTPVQTRADDPAILLYTSGTTGNPKGALLAHRVLLGHLPGVEMSHDFLGQAGDKIWTPADWAWIGGLLDVMAPALALGVPLVASDVENFDPETARDLIEGEAIRNVFFPPTALKMLRASGVAVKGLRSVASGGEPLGSELLDWGRKALGVTINEFYGQTECNMVVSSCTTLFQPSAGSIGKIVPGHHLAVIDSNGNEAEGEGDIAIHRDSPVAMTEYWRNSEATAQKYRGDWLLTGDRGIIEDGYVRFVGRDDDVISTAGYRVGPAPIENALIKHRAVKFAGVIGLPDPERHQIICAFIVLNEGFSAGSELDAELRNHVKSTLAAHEAPRDIRFIDEMPMTVTGKVMRKTLREMAA